MCQDPVLVQQIYEGQQSPHDATTAPNNQPLYVSGSNSKWSGK